MKAAGRAMVFILGLALAGAAAAAQPEAAQQPQAAQWRKHEISFSFTGFTTRYSCGGFEDVLSLLLHAAGARSDAKVVASCMAPMGGPEPISIARLTFYSLVPLKGDAATHAAVPAVPGVWKPVAISAGSPRDLGNGDCEVVDQFARRILPLFTTKDVRNHVNCIPHQVSLGGIDLKFTVLAAPPKAPASAAPESR